MTIEHLVIICLAGILKQTKASHRILVFVTTQLLTGFLSYTIIIILNVSKRRHSIHKETHAHPHTANDEIIRTPMNF